MSRTKRRKKGNPPSEWITHDYVVVDKHLTRDGNYWKYHWEMVPYEGQELKKVLAGYHSDNDRGEFTVPSWFVNKFYTRRKRRADKIKLRKMIFDDDYDKFIFDPYRRSAMYDWD